MEKFQRKCIYLREQLKVFNLGSRFYFQNDSMINNKRKKWSLNEDRRLSRKFAQLMQQTRQLRNINEKDKASNKARIEEAKKVCDRKRVYNLSGIDIPKET